MKRKLPEGVFEGGNGRLYRDGPNGTIIEVFDAAAHADRQLRAIAGMTVTGVRLSDPKHPEKGVVVTLTAEEAGPIVEAIRGVLQARARAE